MQFSDMNFEVNMNFLDMLDDGMHHGALKEINFNETKELDKHLQMPSEHIIHKHLQMQPEHTILPEYYDFNPEKVAMVTTTDTGTGGNRKLRMQRCAAEGCEEVTYKSRTSRNWVCKVHQNRLNKDMLKKKLEERCRTPQTEAGVKKEAPLRPPGGGGENHGGSSNVPSAFRPSLLEEVLNEKKMTLMRSPDVVAFLRGKQKKVEERRRLQLNMDTQSVPSAEAQGAETVSSSSSYISPSFL